ncbi:alpha-keto acid decarboxylase family protein [Plantactinospora sp. S1510]|uniref:Alpha-keto-acid decarboxylase n=1 Tax=Plantactinospora alkalitolerans TaxID=2789879 RepID=A0ABS0GWV1_9ACTN|nr:thiamine pyrophosphate-binding protein [Plantactinospora alkalitolerans]MBF9130686.1 alpha-keto acid decarboxylase family protein [Plantactinospora alkalitolerans]
MITVGELLLSRLHDLGVRHIFGLPGDYNMEFLDQVEAFAGIEWVGSCNELNASYSADGYARLAGIAAIVTTFGPGELSAVCGLAGAMAESVPIVSIVGGPPVRIMEQHAAMHHSLGDGDYDRWVRVGREVTVAQTSLTADNASSEIDRVLCAGWLARRPVYVRLPGDVARQQVAPPSSPLIPPEPAVDPEQLDAFVDAARRLLSNATRPALLVGNLAIRYDLRNLVNSLLNDRNWPVATQSMGRGFIDESSPHFVGIYNGGDSLEPARTAIEGADALVCVGTKFFDWDGLFTADLDLSRIIGLNADSGTVGEAVFPSVPLATALRALHEIAPARTADWEVTIEPGPLLLDSTSTAPLRQARLWSAVAAMLHPGDVLVPETGTPSFGVANFHLPPGTDVLLAPLWGAIGYATPAAFGAGMADPDRRVVLITGDGSLQLTVQEISRMLATGQRPIIIVLNNGGYTVERTIDGAHQPYNDIDDWRYAELPSMFARNTPMESHVAATEGELAGVLAGLAGRPDRLTIIEVRLDAEDVPLGMPRWGRETTALDYQVRMSMDPPRLPWGGLPEQTAS